ncbi:MAG: prepilin peptidase [Candidatus Woesearchaeota archaeon]
MKKMNNVIFAIGLVTLIIGSYTDLKTREVPDWINYGLVLIGIGVSLILSVILTDPKIIIGSLLGLGTMFALGCLMFYTGQWGGGDSKMLMGLGALIGIPIAFSSEAASNIFSYQIINIFSFETINSIFSNTIISWKTNIPFLFGFIIYIFIAGAFYGLIWGIGMAIHNRKAFLKDMKTRINTKKSKIIKIVLLILVLVALGLVFIAHDFFIRIVVLWLVGMFILLFYMFHFVKSIEKVAMIKHVEPEELTEGEWINKDIYVRVETEKGKIINADKKGEVENNNKISKKSIKNASDKKVRQKMEYIAGPKDLGISKEQIEKLIKLKKLGRLNHKIEIKVGIPFVPSFLIAYLLTYFIGIGWLIGLMR